MADITSLSVGEPLSEKDIAILARIFEVTLHSYCKGYDCQSEENLNTELSLIMGLGFTTVLVDNSVIAKYEAHLQTFLRYRNFKDNVEYIGVLSRAVAEMINGTVYLLRYIDRPQYYDGFLEAVKRAVSHYVITASEKTHDAERLLKVLFMITKFSK